MLMKEGLAAPAIERIARALALVLDDFDVSGFRRDALAGIECLELKARVDHVIRVLNDYLPSKFSEAADVLIKLPAVWDGGDPDDPLRCFAIWPLTDYVAVYGLSAPKKALKVMEALTPFFSAEFAIRPFIEKHPELVMTHLQKWVGHKNDHVRRLVSEGTRPRLPWGIRLGGFVDDPSPSLPLLDRLRLDESQYVQRSVANHLNDIAKDHPELVVEMCERWQKEDQGKSDWVISHGTRTLVKAGHPRVFALLGYSKSPAIDVEKITLDAKKVSLGDSLTFSVGLKSRKNRQKCVVDYVVYYQKANGQLAPKVFKLKNVSLNRDEQLILEKAISFKKISTRKFHLGLHALAIQINGVEKARVAFELLAKG